MKILICHNYYRTSSPSGEDAVADNEIALLKEQGHEVVLYSKHNDDLNDSTLASKLNIAKNTIWSKNTYNELKALIGKTKPDIVHFHSIFPQISPSAYKACHDAGAPAVHTLHNFRQICPGALLYRDGKPCELCLHGSLLNSLRYRCYRGSVLATGTLTSTILYNRARSTYTRYVSRYIALTQFAASRFVLGGIPENLITVKPNFLQREPEPNHEANRENYAVYVGRLSTEKGITTLLQAWQTISTPLKIIGDGPLFNELRNMYCTRNNIEFLGFLDKERTIDLIRKALFQVIPSECYEGFPMVVLEAFSCKTPVIASNLGSLGELIDDHRNGLKFEAGNAQSIASAAQELLTNPSLRANLGIAARQTYDNNFSKTASYRQLIKIYDEVINRD